MERRYLVDASQTEKERQRLEARNQEIDGMFLSLYTDKAKGILTEQRFVKLTAALEQEQESNQKRLHDLAMMQSRADAQESEVRTFIKEIRRYATIEELDEAVLNRLISRILIGEVKKVDGQKVQEVRIVYNFVGEIPEIALSVVLFVVNEKKSTTLAENTLDKSRLRKTFWWSTQKPIIMKSSENRLTITSAE